MALLLPLSAVPLSPLPQCREGEHYCSVSDACWYMNASQPEKFFNGRNDAVLGKYFESHSWHRKRYEVGKTDDVAGDILYNVCSVVCGHTPNAKFACGSLGCVDIADCPTASTAVLFREWVPTYEANNLVTIHTADTHGIEDVGYHDRRRHTLALNLSSVVLSLYGKPVPLESKQQYLDRMMTLASKAVPAYIHTAVHTVVNPHGWGNATPDAEIFELDITNRWSCRDNILTVVKKGCKFLLPLGCDAQIPKRYLISGRASGGETVASVCEVSCGTCTLGTTPTGAPEEDVCANRAEVSLCVQYKKAQLACADSVVGEYARKSSCTEVELCPDVLAVGTTCSALCPNSTDVNCTKAGLYEPQQKRSGYAFCVDEVTGEELNGTRVPVSQESALLCRSQTDYIPICMWFLSSPACTSYAQDTARPRILSLGNVVFKFSAGKAKSVALRGVLEQEIKHGILKIEADTPGNVVLSVYPAVDELIRSGLSVHDTEMLFLATSVELEQTTLAFLQRTLDTPFTWEAANEVMLYEPEELWEPLATKTAVAEIPGKLRVTITKSYMSDAEVHVEFLNSFEKEQPPGGYYWGLYHPRVDGKCPIPDDAVFDPHRAGLHRDCVTKDRNLWPFICRRGDMTRKFGKLREQKALFKDASLELSGWGSALGKVVVLRGNGVHCALIVPQTEAGEGVALVADFSHETTQMSGVELSGSVNIWQKGPWEDTLIGVSLRAGEELRDVSFHISSKRLEEYPEGCAVGYTPDTDLFDPYAATVASQGRAERQSPKHCLEYVNSSHAKDYVFNCPVGDLTPHMLSARRIVTNASNPANSNDAPVVYTYTATHHYLNVVNSPGALRPSDASFRGGHTLVLLHEGRVVACARLTGKGDGEAYVGQQQQTSEVNMHLIWGAVVVVACAAVLAVGYYFGRSHRLEKSKASK